MFDKNLIYLDSAAGLPLDPEVIKVINNALALFAHPMSVHKLGVYSRNEVESARKVVADYFNKKRNNVIFTSSGTEANNMIINSFDNVLTSVIEHSSVSDLCNNYKKIALKSDMTVDLDELESILAADENVKLVSIVGADSIMGSIQPLEEIAQICEKYGVLFHSDIVQILGKIEVNSLPLAKIDYLTISGHKIGGPQGVGAVVMSDKGRRFIKSLIFGGKAEFGFRAGGYNVPGILGFAKALELLDVKIWQKVGKLRDQMEKEIAIQVPEAVVIRDMTRFRVPNISLLRMPGIETISQLIYFDLEGFALASAASACASGTTKESQLIKELGFTTQDFIRVSFGPNNTVEEVKKFVNAWKNIYSRRI